MKKLIFPLVLLAGALNSEAVSMAILAVLMLCLAVCFVKAAASRY